VKAHYYLAFSAASPLCFGQLVQRLSLISRQVLTEQLKELEEDGVVRREAFTELPPRVEYSLTEYRHALLPIIDQLSAWHYASPKLAATADE
jgi:DNA-binding HxlR family transcriptional regulator